ncbi:MAG: GNAT family N-acetyltransferase [Parvularculales bacterium]
MVTGDISIRKLSAGDKECWAPLWAAYLDFYETTGSEEIFSTTFSRLVNDDFDACEGYMAFADGNAAGIVHCLYHVHLWQEEKTCYLQDLYVDKRYRRIGIAGKLIQQIYARSDEKGAKGVYWMTQDFNSNARKLYDEIGVKTPFIKYTRS